MGFPRGSHPIQIVATPGSGNGRALDTARQLRDALRARGREVRLEAFSNLGSLGRWAKTGRAGFSLLICVGGDGTQSTAAVAAVRRSVPFLPVPCGFGNLFARALGHAHDVDQVIETLEQGKLVRVDVGVRNGELFLCQESFGLWAQIQQKPEAGRPPGRWRRSLAYYRTALRQLLEVTPKRLRVAVDGRLVAHDAVIVTVANVPTYGAWLPLTPAASPIDGLFDVFIMRAMTTGEILARLLKRHLHVPGTERGTLLCRGRRVSIVGPRSARHVLEVIPHRLPVVVSRQTAETLERGLARDDAASGRSRRVA